MNHSISDFIIRIKNASCAHRKTVSLPYSKLNNEVGKVLVQQGFLVDVKEEADEGKKYLVATIRYEKRIPIMTDVILFSKPSLRVYTGFKDIEKVAKKGRGVSILSTSLGIMTGRQASKKGIGGELLFKIW